MFDFQDRERRAFFFAKTHELYYDDSADEQVQVDGNTFVSPAGDDGACWVQGWLRIPRCELVGTPYFTPGPELDGDDE